MKLPTVNLEELNEASDINSKLMDVLKEMDASPSVQYFAVLMLFESMKTTFITMGINPDEI
jgi:hypothetical protein